MLSIKELEMWTRTRKHGCYLRVIFENHVLRDKLLKSCEYVSSLRNREYRKERIGLKTGRYTFGGGKSNKENRGKRIRE